MRLSSFVLPALAGLAAAETQDAEAYILRSQSSQSDHTPPIPATVAEAILQQRLSYGKQLSEQYEENEYHTITRFGKTTQRLFTDASAAEPQQLVVIIKNADEDRLKGLKKALSGQKPSFTTPRLDTLPSSYLPSWVENQCAFEHAIDPGNQKCWHSKVLYLEFDAVKNQKDVKLLSQSFAKLRALAKSEMETTLVLLPRSSTPSNVNRRDVLESEHTMSKATKPEASADSSTDKSFDPHPFVPKLASPIPACFASVNACETATASCSGHGACQNKYSKASATACFTCHCQKTHEGKGKSVWYWGGAACQKQDVSIPFWIFVGFTIFMVGAVGFSINLLFSVGEEKLPGVIGAGVSRGSK